MESVSIGMEWHGIGTEWRGMLEMAWKLHGVGMKEVEMAWELHGITMVCYGTTMELAGAHWSASFTLGPH